MTAHSGCQCLINIYFLGLEENDKKRTVHV